MTTISPIPAPYTHSDGRTLRLGKLAPVYDSRALHMSKYTSALPPPPPSCDWTRGVINFGEMLNNKLGCCAESAIGHATQIVTLNTHDYELTPANSIIELLYEYSSGYIPGDPSTDNGSVVAYVLNYVLKHGLGTHRRNRSLRALGELSAYAYVDPLNVDLVKQSLATFGVVDIGLALPITCQSQIGGIWNIVGNPATDPDSMPNSWGGHSTVLVGYRTINGCTQFLTITWGKLQWIAQSFFTVYVDEAYVLLYAAWLKKLSAQASDLVAQLEADFHLIT